MDDDSLIHAAGGGDERALRELFSRHAPWLAARLRRVLAAHAVEDVLQETFVAVWRGARSYRPDGHAAAWLWGIARRQAALWVRRNGYRQAAPPELVTGDPEQLAVDRVSLAAALAGLDDADQDLVRLLYLEDQPVSQVAARLRLAEGTVKSRAHRIRRLLRAALGHGEA